MQGTVTILRDKKGKIYPVGKELIYREIGLSFDGESAYIIKDDRCKENITKVKVEYIATDGMKINELEEKSGCDGNWNYTYQEWWFQLEGKE